jgi:hypothetical protein
VVVINSMVTRRVETAFLLHRAKSTYGLFHPVIGTMYSLLPSAGDRSRFRLTYALRPGASPNSGEILSHPAIRTQSTGLRTYRSNVTPLQESATRPL